jgi:hypothetical protein
VLPLAGHGRLPVQATQDTPTSSTVAPSSSRPLLTGVFSAQDRHHFTISLIEHDVIAMLDHFARTAHTPRRLQRGPRAQTLGLFFCTSFTAASGLSWPM